MADKRIDAHTNTTTVANVDEFIVDSGANGTRNITYSDLKAQLLGTTSIAAIGNTVTEAIYNVHMDQAVPKIDTTTGVMYLEGGSAFEGNIDSTPTAGSNNAVSSGGTKTYVDNAVSQLNAEIDAISASLTENTFNTVAYKASSTNYEYNGCSYTVPNGKVAILYGRTQYSSGKPVGLALSLSSTQLNVISETSNVGNYVLRTPCCMVGGGNTVYLWEKRESVPGSTNTSFIIGMLIG